MNINNTEQSKWLRVNRKNPCAICGKPDWCTSAADGTAACCMRVQSEKAMKNGGWLHMLNGQTTSPTVIETVKYDRGPGVTLTKYAQARGLDPEHLKRAGWQDYDYKGASAILIPYLDELGNLLRNRLRLNLSKDDGARFIWGKGNNTYPYGLNNLAFIRQQGYVILVEGEGDAEALLSHGFPALGIPGAQAWKSEWKVYFKGLKVYAWEEPDQALKDGIGFAHRLGKDFSSLPIIKAPLEAKDAARLLLLEGANFSKRVKELIEATKPGKTRTRDHFQLTKLSDLLKEPDEDFEYLWENTLIKGGLSIVVAKPKVGKSTLVRNLVKAFANGEPSFLGRNIAGPGPVVYLALEEKRSEVKKHFERMGATDKLPIFIHTGSAPEQAIMELQTVIIENKALLAIIDPLQHFVRVSDLNDYSRVSLALEPIMQIARDTGCHILLIHHANKGIAREGGDSILGSTAIFGSVDCALIMKRNESYRTIESIQRYGEDLPKTVLAYDVVTGLTTSGGSQEDNEVADCKKDIFELLSDQEITEKEIKDELTQYKGGIVSKSLRLLFQEGVIQRQGHGRKNDPYRYTVIPQIAGDSGDCGDNHIEIPAIPNNILQAKLKEDNNLNLFEADSTKAGVGAGISNSTVGDEESGDGWGEL